MFDQTIHNLPLLSLLRLAGLAGLALAACTADEPGESPNEEAQVIELRGGAVLALRPGTALDLDELESRERYGATLTDDLGQPWFVRVELSGDDLLAEPDLQHVIVDGAEAHIGAVRNDNGRGCLVHVPLAAGAAVVLSRSEGADPCPVHAEELGWLPEIHMSESGAAAPLTFDIADNPKVALGTCGQVFHPSVSGGEATWTLSCSGGNITMKGWVKDTSWDNKCAYVQGVFNNNIIKLVSACGKGTTTNFSWTYPGTLANGYLMVK